MLACLGSLVGRVWPNDQVMRQGLVLVLVLEYRMARGGSYSLGRIPL